MLKNPAPTQQEIEMVMLKMLVPKGRLLRKIEAVVDLERGREEGAHLRLVEQR